eukprot:maker-scaffold116_size340332-snap-gene-1.11 protein:Tk07654 transcript:maker-scaffold116_size340332-snap-gene-1.11-mRNA-1 annotation:"GH19368"
MGKDHNILTRAKLTSILEHIHPDSSVTIRDWDVCAGTEKGQNFCADLQACTVTAEVNGVTKDYHWMIKLPLDDPNRIAVNRASHMEEKEIKFLSHLVPNLKDFIAQRQTEIDLAFCRAPYTEYPDEVDPEQCQKGSMLVMEHLGHFGFRDCPTRRSGFDLAHVKLILGAVAKMHAVSHAYFKDKYNGDLKSMIQREELYCRDFFSTNPDEVMVGVTEFLRKVMYVSWANSLEKAQKPGQDLPASMKRSMAQDGDFFERRGRLFTPTEGEFNVLNHGDMWFNNMLFKYGSDGGPKEVRFVDLAVIRWASPCTDLAFFFFTSTTPELREAHLDELLEFYQAELAHTFSQLNEDPHIYTLEQLKIDYNKYALLGFIMSLWVLPAALTPKDTTEQFEGLMTDWGDVGKAQEHLDQMSIKQEQTKLEPQGHLNSMIHGNFMDMVKRGVLTLK